VVVDRDRELLLRLFLADHVPVQELLDLFGFGELGLGSLGLQDPVLGDDVETDIDALVADVDRRTRDEFLDVPLTLVAEGTAKNVAVTAFLRHSASGKGQRIPGTQVRPGSGLHPFSSL
jgi:hypothetical protein